jgi:hypothetical protein
VNSPGMRRNAVAQRTSQSPERLVLAAALAILGLATSIGVTYSPRGAAAAIVLSIAAVSIWIFRRHFLIVMLVILWYLPGQTAPGGLLSSVVFLRWTGLLLVPLVVAVIAAFLARSGRRLVLTPVLPPIVAAMMVVVTSAIVNHSSLLDTGTTLVLYLRYPLLFVALVNLPIRRRPINNFVAAFICLAGLEVLEVLFRYLVQGVYWDAVSWTLGPWGHVALGIYLVYAMCLTTAAIAVRGITLPRILFLGALLVPAVLGEIKALLIAGPLCVAAIMLLPMGRLIPLRRRLVVIVSIVIVTVLLFVAWATVYRGSANALSRFVNQVGNIMQNRGSLDSGLGLDRLSWTAEATSALSAQNNLLLGAGPGSSLAGTATGVTSRMLTNGVPGSTHTQIGTMLWDMGIVGLISYAWLLLAALGLVMASLRRVSDARTRVYALAMVGMWLFYAILGPNYDLVWRADSASFVFWTLLAGVWVSARSASRGVVRRHKTSRFSRPSGDGSQGFSRETRVRSTMGRGSNIGVTIPAELPFAGKDTGSTS